MFRLRRVIATTLTAVSMLALPSQANAVVGIDRPVHAGEAAWVGSVVSWHPEIGWASFCSGSLIAPRILLTAAHCVMDAVDQETWKVVIGQSAQDAADGQTIDVIGAIYHTKYEVQQSYDLVDPETNEVLQSVTGYVAPGESDLDADIALLFLEKPVVGIKPVSMGSTVTRRAPNWRVYGWGFTSTDSYTGSNVLNTTSVADATKEMSEMIDDPMDNMLAAYLEDEQGVVHNTCFGDSGGPLVDGNGYLIGITSFSFAESCEEASPTVYVKVASYRSWILRASAKITRHVNRKPGEAIAMELSGVKDKLGNVVYHPIRIISTY